MQRLTTKISFTFILLAIFVCSVPTTGAAENSQGIKSRYFNIHIKSDIDLHQFANQTGLLSFAGSTNPQAVAGESVEYIGPGMDRMLDQAAEVLGLNMQNFECRIEVFATDADLKRTLDGIFGIKEGEQAVYFHREYPAFYLHENNTIYLSMQTATVGVIGHEMTHALISKYFVVPPTERIQEILAGYVEYSLKKALR